MKNWAADWDRLHIQYKTHGLALFLGAGVSYGSGIPGWEELVRRLFVLRNRSKDEFDRLRAAGYSLPAITEFIRAEYSERFEFLNAVRDSLYRDFPCKGVLKAHEAPGSTEIVDHIQSRNKTLAALYDLATGYGGGKLAPNPNVSCIVSLNLDSLLESYDSALNAKIGGNKRCLHTIEGPGLFNALN